MCYKLIICPQPKDPPRLGLPNPPLHPCSSLSLVPSLRLFVSSSLPVPLPLPLLLPLPLPLPLHATCCCLIAGEHIPHNKSGWHDSSAATPVIVRIVMKQQHIARGTKFNVFFESRCLF